MKWNKFKKYTEGEFAELMGKRWRCLQDNQASPPGQAYEHWAFDPVPDPVPEDEPEDP